MLRKGPLGSVSAGLVLCLLGAGAGARGREITGDLHVSHCHGAQSRLLAISNKAELRVIKRVGDTVGEETLAYECRRGSDRPVVIDHCVNDACDVNVAAAVGCNVATAIESSSRYGDATTVVKAADACRARVRRVAF